MSKVIGVLIVAIGAGPASAKPPARNAAERALTTKNAGDKKLAEGDLRGACQSYQHAAKILPAWWIPHIAIAQCGRFAGLTVGEVLAHAERAVKARPGLTVTQYQYGFALEEAGQVDKAIKAYEKALAVYANHHDARYRLGVLLARRGRYKDARRHLEELLKSRNWYIVARVELTRLYEKLKLYDLAESGHRDLIMRSRNPAQALSRLVRFYERIGWKAKAKAARQQYYARFGR